MPERSSPPTSDAPQSRAASERERQTFAAIDLGSSSAKMLVARDDERGRLHTLADVKIGTGLGRDLGPGGAIPDANEQRALAAVRELVAVAAEHGVSARDVSLIATAVVRNAGAAGEAFLRRLAGETGLGEALILSAEEEAEMGFLGATAGLEAEPHARLATFDLGGGSFQLAVGTQARMERGGSTQLGSNHIQERLLPDGIITPADFAAADRRLAGEAPLPLSAETLAGCTWVGTGGISKFLRHHLGKTTITRGEVDALRREVGALSVDERGPFLQRGKSADEQRALGIDTPRGALLYGQKLPASATLLLRILDGLGVDAFHASATDSRHALVRRMRPAR